MKKLSCRQRKVLSKPWIATGFKVSTRMKNKLFSSGDEVRYKYYINNISSLIRISKKYYSDYFEANMSNFKNKTWTGINELSFRRKEKRNTIIAIKDPIYKNKLVKDFSHIPNIADEHFATVGSKLASKIPSSQQHYLDFVNKTMSPIPRDRAGGGAGGALVPPPHFFGC